jgi:hypothetical protein
VTVIFSLDAPRLEKDIDVAGFQPVSGDNGKQVEKQIDVG